VSPPMHVPLSRRSRKAPYAVSGNVIWLVAATAARDDGRIDPIASLRQSMSRLAAEIDRSDKLKTDIRAAIHARRYEMYKGSTHRGVRESERGLAAAQSLHVGSLLQVIHAIAEAGVLRAGADRQPSARPAVLAQSLRALEHSLRRARQLSQDMLAQCQGGEWRHGGAQDRPHRR
jgi:hypothetical protein